MQDNARKTDLPAADAKMLTPDADLMDAFLH